MKKTALPQYDILKAYTLATNSLDDDDLQLAVVEMNSELEQKINNQLQLCDLHKRRLKYLASLILRTPVNEIVNLFGYYLHSVIEIARTSPSPGGVDFFNSKIVGDDFQKIIKRINKSQPLIDLCSALSSVYPTDKIGDCLLPHGSQWELLFVNQLQTEISAQPAKASDYLRQLQFFSQGGHLAALTTSLFKTACKYSLANQDIAYFQQATPLLIAYLFTSGQYQQMGNLPSQLVMMLLAKAQNRVRNAFLLLCQFAALSITHTGTGLIEKLLTAMVKPKVKGDDDQNYYSTYAMGYLLSYVLNDPRLARFVNHPQGTDLQTAFYRQSLAFYFNDYFLDYARQIQKNDFVIIIELIRLFDLARREFTNIDSYGKIISERLPLALFHARLAKQSGEIGGINIFKMTELFIDNLFDCFSYRRLVEILIQAFNFEVDGKVRVDTLVNTNPIYSAVFSALASPQRNNETHNKYRKRMASVIMLAYHYQLTENILKYYVAMLQDEVKASGKHHQDRLILSSEFPGPLCEAILCVLQQHKRFFPDRAPSSELITDCINAWVAANSRAISLPGTHGKIAALISKLTVQEFVTVCANPRSFVAPLFSEFKAEWVMRISQIFAGFDGMQILSCREFEQYFRYLMDNQQFPALRRILNAAYMQNYEQFEALLQILLRNFVVNAQTGEFIFSYVSTLDNHAKAIFRRSLESLLSIIPKNYWAEGFLKEYMPTLFEELCVVPTHHHNSLKILLSAGANPFVKAKVSCAFIEAIKHYGTDNGALEIICEYTIANKIKVDFEFVYSVCPDPLGLATRYEVPTQTLELMIRMGFDVNKYQFSTHQKNGHELIAKHQKPAHAKNGNRRTSFGFFNPKNEEEIPAIYMCELSTSIMEDPVFCTLDGRNYERFYIRDWLLRSGRATRNADLLLWQPADVPVDEAEARAFKEARVNSALFANTQLKSAIDEFKAAYPHLFNDDSDDEAAVGVGNSNNQ